MKIDTRTLLRDIQAAARIGHIESLWAALEGLLDIPQMAGNHQLDESFIRKVIVPVGEALARPMVTATALQPLINHELAGLRAVGGAALALRYLKGINGTALKDLKRLGQDPRQDVRTALVLAFNASPDTSPQKLGAVIDAWLAESSPRLKTVALSLLPALPPEETLSRLQGLDGRSLSAEPEVRRALFEAVDSLGKNEMGEQALALLADWAQDAETYYWVIARCLAKSWAAAFPEKSLAILTTLAAQQGPKKKIRTALQAIQTHGADQQVRQTVQQWQAAENKNLQEAGNNAADAVL